MSKGLKIIFDARILKVQPYGGISRYASSLIFGMLESNKLNIKELNILTDGNENNRQKSSLYDKIAKIKDERVTFKDIDAPLFSLKHHVNVSAYVNNTDCDLFFFPHFDIPFFIKKKTVFVVHDLSPLVMDNYFIDNQVLKKIYFKNVIKWHIKSDFKNCIAISKNTKQDILNYIHNDLENIKTVYEANSLNNVSSKVRDKNLPDNFLLYVGNRRPNKNLKFLIDVFKLLKEKFNYSGDLLLAGNSKNYQENIDALISNRSDINFLESVSDDVLISLYKKTDALFYPSLYEGFGLPIVEAAGFGKKIITSDRSSMKEIAPDWTCLIDPTSADYEGVAKKISDYLSSPISIDPDSYPLNHLTWADVAEQIFGEFNDPKI